MTTQLVLKTTTQLSAVTRPQ